MVEPAYDIYNTKKRPEGMAVSCDVTQRHEDKGRQPRARPARHRSP